MSTEHPEAVEARPPGEDAKPQLIKLAVELGPLLLFFGVYWGFGIYPATAVLMAATLISLVASRLLLGKISPMPIVTAVVVCVFGALTFWLNDPSFIKMKPTFVNLAFAAVLGGGLLAGKPLVKMLFGEQLKLTDRGWSELTVRWMLFFLAMAALNEVVWRSFSEATWVSFKVFGLLPLSLAFAVAQIGLIKRHQIGS
jgi:intracellular septation protein